MTILASNLKIVRAAHYSEFVVQRGGTKDCVIASIATAIGQTYEYVAQLLEVQLEEGKVPRDFQGVDSLDAIGVLFRAGWNASPLISREAIEGKPSRPAHLASDEIKKLIKGHRAIVGYLDADPNVGHHSLAWDGHHAIDCSNGTIVDLKDATIHCAMVLTKRAGVEAH
jgi:hypothetical protein